jgi:hypothetical protein
VSLFQEQDVLRRMIGDIIRAADSTVVKPTDQ